MAAMAPGDVLGDRFEILGVVGRGGSAVVYLAQDRLRNERVALKVVHDHLSADAGVRKRLLREVQSATVLRCDSALVPNDLHELDGKLALSMPFHPGESLDAHVAAHGPMAADEVRTVGMRVARALAEAHRAGVLHRDVSAANIMVSPDPADTVLTDFGLARLRHGGTRSTAMLGTAGYAAPEVYSGDRADPRSDLYGLGAALYLALTGKPAFSATDPVTALRQQLDDGFRPVRELRPDAPDELVALVESLLRADPGARPPGAREVLDLLEQRAAPSSMGVRAVDPVVRQYLPPGTWTLVVKERDEDKGRRKALRADRRRAPETIETSIQRVAEKVAQVGREWLGLPTDRGPTPEDVLAAAVAQEAGLGADALVVPDIVYDRRFRLIDRTDHTTVHRLAEAARSAGFRAKPVIVGEPETPQDWLAAYFWVPIAVGWSMLPFVGACAGILHMGELAALWIPLMVLVSIVMPTWASARGRRDPHAAQYPLAYRADLRDVLTEGDHVPPRYAVGVVDASPPTNVIEAPATRGEGLLQRVTTALDLLRAAIEAPDLQLPVPAQRDLRSTAKELGQQAEALAREVDQLETALTDQGAPEREVSILRARLDRLRTLQRAGDGVSDTEIAQIERTIAEHDADLAAHARVEARLAASTAQLLEIASTASKVHRTLLADADVQTSTEGVERLQREVEATRRARQEAARRQADPLRR